MNLLSYAYVSIFFWILSDNFFNCFIFIFDKCNRKIIIKDRVDKEDYLERYYLFLKERKHFPFNIFLHKFLKSDSEDLHDHPWNFTTIILSGGYWEHTQNNKIWYGPGSIIKKKATDLHRIELDPNSSTTWTLFIPGKKIREWGFKVEDKWIDNDKYLKEKKL